jgi:hypothetical protein
MDLRDILETLQAAGIQASDFVYMAYSLYGFQDQLTWTFSTIVPFDTMNEKLAALFKVRQAASKKDPPVTVDYQAWGTQSSGICALPTLFSDAQGLAEKLASAAGVRLGTIVALWDTGPGAIGVVGVQSVGRFFDAATLQLPVIIPAGIGGVLPSCSLFVQFRILR